jgi:uncharacterized protein with HEPN domain
MKKRNRAILMKIIDETKALAQMLHGIDKSTFIVNDEKMRAVCMTLINIGELIKNLDDDFRQEHGHVPWKSMAGFRDVA